MCQHTKSSGSHIGVRARGLGAVAPPLTRAKPLFFGQKPNFSGRSQQPKMKKDIFFAFIRRKKGIHAVYSKIKCPKSGIVLLIIIGWGELGKSNIWGQHSRFSGAVEKIFGQRWLSPPPLEKIGPYANE